MCARSNLSASQVKPQCEPGQTSVCTRSNLSVCQVKPRCVPGQTSVCARSNLSVCQVKPQCVPGQTTVCARSNLSFLPGQAAVCARSNLSFLPGQTSVCARSNIRVCQVIPQCVPDQTSECARSNHSVCQVKPQFFARSSNSVYQIKYQSVPGKTLCSVNHLETSCFANTVLFQARSSTFYIIISMAHISIQSNILCKVATLCNYCNTYSQLTVSFFPSAATTLKTHSQDLT